MILIFVLRFVQADVRLLLADELPEKILTFSTVEAGSLMSKVRVLSQDDFNGL